MGREKKTARDRRERADQTGPVLKAEGGSRIGETESDCRITKTKGGSRTRETEGGSRTLRVESGSRTMKELPEQERPYEKCARLGPESLSDAELLAVLLRTGSRGETSLELARRILAEANPPGLLGLLHLTLPQLTEQRGIGRVKGLELLCAGELSRRIWRALTLDQTEVFSDPAAISAFYMEEMRHREQEELHVMMLNTKHALIRDVLLFRGTVNMSVASPREVFLEALRYHAVSIILVHNHPSGDPSPSGEDRRLTDRIREAGALLGVCLLDHVIIGDQSYFSFRERGLL